MVLIEIVDDYPARKKWWIFPSFLVCSHPTTVMARRIHRLKQHWLVAATYPSDIFVSWDYDIPNWMESHSKFHGSSHQPDYHLQWACEKLHNLLRLSAGKSPNSSRHLKNFPADRAAAVINWGMIVRVVMTKVTMENDHL